MPKHGLSRFWSNATNIAKSILFGAVAPTFFGLHSITGFLLTEGHDLPGLFYAVVEGFWEPQSLTLGIAFSIFALGLTTVQTYTHDIAPRLEDFNATLKTQGHEFKALAAQYSWLEGINAVLSLKTRPVPKCLQDALMEHVNAVRRILEGRTRMTHEAPAHFWTKYVRFFDDVSPGGDFLATCVIPNSTEGIDSVFGQDAFKTYCSQSYHRVRSGQLSSMKKLFIFEKRKDVDNFGLLLDHFEEIRAVEQKHLGKLEAKAMILEEYLENFPGERAREADYMIWGNDLLVREELDTNLRLVSVELDTIPGSITEKRRAFETKFSKATPLAQWVANNKSHTLGIVGSAIPANNVPDPPTL
jgi:hypothetical protein